MTQVLEPAAPARGRVSVSPAEALQHLAGVGAPALALTYLAHATGGREHRQLAVGVVVLALAAVVLRCWRLPARWLVGAGWLGGAAVAVALLHPPAAGDALGRFYRWPLGGGYVVAALVVLVVRAYATTPQRRRALVLVATAAGALQFGWAFTPWWAGGYPAGEMLGTFYWHNQYAAFLLAPGVLGLALALEGRRPWRFLGWVTAALAGAGVVYSTSRATLALLVAGWAVVGAYALVRGPRRRVTAVRLAGLVAAAAVVVVAMATPPIVRTARSPFAAEQTRTADQSLGQNGGYRLQFWHEAAVVAARHPLAGAGYGEIPPAVHGHVPATYAVSPLAHEGVLQAFADGGLLLGLPLLGGLLLLVGAALRRLWTLLRGGPDVVGVATVVAFGGLLAHALLDFDWSYPALFAMGAVVASLAAGRDASAPTTTSAQVPARQP